MNPATRLFGRHGDVLGDTDFLLLLLANAVYPFGALFVSPVLESLVGPLGTDPNAVGLLISAYYAPAVLVTPFVGVLVDRIGRKPLLVAGLFLFGAGGTAVAFTTAFEVALGLRLLQGVGAAAILPVVITSIGDRYDDARESTAQGLRGAVHASSGAAAPMLAAGVFVFGWQYPFLLYSVALAVAPVVLLWYSDPMVETAADGAGEPSSGSTRSRIRRIGTQLATPGIGATMTAVVIPAFLWTGFLTYNSFVIAEGVGESPQFAGLLVTIGLVGGAGAASQIGRINDRFRRRYLSPIVAHSLLGLGLIVFVLAESYPLSVAGAVFQGLGFGYLVSYYRSVVTRAATEDTRGSLVGVAETVRGIGVTLPPILMGFGIQLVSPTTGFLGAIRTVSIVVALVGTVTGVVCVLVIRTSSVSL